MNYTFLSLIILSYLALNIYVSDRIKQSRYLNEQRRNTHLRFIWIVPFLGPLIIRSFWKKKSEKLEVMAGKKRKRKPGSGFYESGLGVSSGEGD